MRVDVCCYAVSLQVAARFAAQGYFAVSSSLSGIIYRLVVNHLELSVWFKVNIISKLFEVQNFQTRFIYHRQGRNQLLQLYDYIIRVTSVACVISGGLRLLFAQLNVKYSLGRFIYLFYFAIS
jgi:hypothetical protein